MTALIVSIVEFIVLFFVESCLGKLLNYRKPLEAVMDQHDHRFLLFRRILCLPVFFYRILFFPSVPLLVDQRISYLGVL